MEKALELKKTYLVSKADERIELLGTIDELSSFKNGKSKQTIRTNST